MAVQDRLIARCDHAVANTWWDSKSLPTWLTEECYVQRIQPLLRGKKVREIAQAMKVSQPYAAFIRSGRRRPHPRHSRPMSAPRRVTFQSYDPQGCGLRIRTVSFSCKSGSMNGIIPVRNMIN